MKVWLNGTQVHSSNVGRGISSAVDKVNVSLVAGWNALLLKVINSAGPTGYAVCIADTNDAPLTDLLYSTSGISVAPVTPPVITQPPGSTLAGYDAAGNPIYVAMSLPADQQAAAYQEMFSGYSSLPSAPKSDFLVNAADTITRQGIAVTPQLVFYAGIGIAVILAAMMFL